MLTEVGATVDEPARPQGHWLSVSALADARGITKQAVSKALRAYVEAGKTVSTRPEGRSLLVNVAEFDRARGEVGDIAKAQGEATKRARGDQDSAAPIYTSEQARKMAYEADLKKLDLDERLGKLVAVEALQDATIRCGEVLVRVIDQLVVRADEISAAVAKDGVAGARAALKKIARDLRHRACDEFTRLPALAMNGPAISEDEAPPLDPSA